MITFLLSCSTFNLTIGSKISERDQKFINAVIELRSTDEIQAFLSKGADPNVIFEDGDSALHKAIQHERVDLIDLLLQERRFKSVNWQNKQKLTPLMIAIEKGDIETVKKLLNHNVFLNIRDKEGKSVLEKALLIIANKQDDNKLLSREEVAITLLERKRLDILSNEEKKQLLYLVCKTKNRNILKKLSEKITIDLDCARESLFLIVEEQLVDLLEVILQNNPEISLDISHENKSLFLSAIEKRNTRLVEIIIESISVVEEREDGRLGLIISLSYGDEEIVEILLKHGVKIQVINQVHPLIIASEKGNAKLVKMLIERGTDKNLNFNGVTPLMAAIKADNKEAVKELINLGVDTNTEINGELPLFVACKINEILVKFLIDGGANIDAEKGGITPFEAAAEAGKISVMRELLYRDVNYQLSEDPNLDYESEKFISFLNLDKKKKIREIDKNEVLKLEKQIQNDPILLSWLKRGNSVLEEEIHGDPKLVAWLLSEDQAAYRTPDGITPLMYAVISGDYEYVVDLVNKRGAHYQARDIRGLTALDYALIKIEIESDPNLASAESTAAFLQIARFLLSLYKRESFLDDDIDSICRLSARIGDENLYKEIFEKMKRTDQVRMSVMAPEFRNANTTNKACQARMLIEASRAGNLGLIEKIFEWDTTLEVDQRDKNDNTALMYSGSMDIFDYLLKKGANIKAENNFGTNVLMSVVQGQSEDLEKILKRLLLERDISIDHKDKEGKTALIYAAMSGSERGVEFLLIRMPNVDLADKNGKTALMYAATICSTEIVKSLITAERASSEERLNEFLNAKDKKGITALMHGMRKGGLDCVKALLGINEKVRKKEHIGADLMCLDLQGRNVLTHAAISGAIEFLDFLIEEGLDLEIVDREGRTCLMYAIKKYKLAMVQELINKGVSISTKDNKGKNALMYAAELKYGGTEESIFKELLNAGAVSDVNSFDNYGKTPLMFAIERGRLEATKRLLEERADTKAVDEKGLTPLMYACKQKNRGLTRFLINQFEYDLDYLNKMDNENKTALFYAIEEGDRDVVEQLLSKEVKYDPKDLLNYFYGSNNLGILKFFISSGIIELDIELSEIFLSQDEDFKENLLMLAVRRGNKHLVNLLLNAGAEINQRREDDRTPLMLAIESGQKEIIKLLLERGADVNQKDQDDWTSLMLASYYGYCDVLEILLERVQSSELINARNKTNMTALMYAIEKGNMDIFTLLTNDPCIETEGILMVAVRKRRLAMIKYILENDLVPDKSELDEAINLVPNDRELLELLNCFSNNLV